MKIFNKTLAAVAVATVSSLFAQKANAQDFVTDDFDMEPTTEVSAPESSTKSGWERIFGDEDLKIKNIEQIEAVQQEIETLKKSRRFGDLTDKETTYYTKKLSELGCGVATIFLILNPEYQED